jgi:DNA-binding NarL/FixJ family response regulator
MLSPRQEQIAALLAQGYSPKQIALRLTPAVTESTVRAQIHLAGHRLPGEGKPVLRIIRYDLSKTA